MLFLIGIAQQPPLISIFQNEDIAHRISKLHSRSSSSSSFVCMNTSQTYFYTQSVAIYSYVCLYMSIRVSLKITFKHWSCLNLGQVLCLRFTILILLCNIQKWHSLWAFISSSLNRLSHWHDNSRQTHTLFIDNNWLAGNWNVDCFEMQFKWENALRNLLLIRKTKAILVPIISYPSLLLSLSLLAWSGYK